MESPGGVQKGASGTYLFQDQFRHFTFWFNSDSSYNCWDQHFSRMKWSWEYRFDLEKWIQKSKQKCFVQETLPNPGLETELS